MDAKPIFIKFEESIMKNTIKLSLLIALGLTASSAMAIPPPDEIIVCESNQKYVKFIWNGSAIDDQYRKYSQPYDPSNFTANSPQPQTITAHEFMMNCPLSGLPAEVSKSPSMNPGGLGGTTNPVEIQRGPAVRSDEFDPGSLNPGKVQRPKPTQSRESARPEMDKRE